MAPAMASAKMAHTMAPAHTMAATGAGTGARMDPPASLALSRATATTTMMTGEKGSATAANVPVPLHVQQQQQQQHTPPSQTQEPPNAPASETNSLNSSTANNVNARKPRVNVDEADQVAMVTHAHALRAHYGDGTKAQFWAQVGQAFGRETGKTLAQLSATVGRLVEARRRQLNDWNRGVLPARPGGPLNDALDRWMAFLREHDEVGEAEKMATVESRRLAEEQRKLFRRHTSLGVGGGSGGGFPAQADGSMLESPAQSPSLSQPVQALPALHLQTVPNTQTPTPYSSMPPRPAGASNGAVTPNGHAHDHELSNRPAKRRRVHEPRPPREWQDQLPNQLQDQLPPETYRYQQQHMVPEARELPRRVVVEGALTKEDWRDIMGNDARLRALEAKVDRIETLVAVNNKLLLQLVARGQRVSDDHHRTSHRHGSEFRQRSAAAAGAQSGAAEPGANADADGDSDAVGAGEGDGVDENASPPIHLDDDFERGYL